jgi:hypothetical protein
MSSFINKIKAAAAAAGLVAMTGSAHAVLVGAGGTNPYDFQWSFNTGTSLLTGTGSMTLSGFNSSALTVTITLNNTSAIGGQGGERLTVFGFGIDPNASSITFADAADGGMVDALLGSNFPSLQNVDVCATGGNNCAAGGNGGIFAGTSDTFSIILGGNWGSSVNIEPVAFKYQTGYGSFEFTTTTSTTTTSGPPGSGNMPEPGTGGLALLGLGLLGAGFAMRRKQASPAI